MRFAAIFKYRMRDCLISCGVVMLVMVVMTVLSYFGIVTFGGYEESVDGVVTERFATMNFTMPYVIFMFVVGIVTIREDMRIGIQNGAGRTTSFLANLACLAATALLLNLNCLVFYKLWALLDTELIIIDLYSMAFLQEMTPDTLGEMLMCFITGTAASLALAGCGVMLSLVYWRLGKAGKWILSLGMGADGRGLHPLHKRLRELRLAPARAHELLCLAGQGPAQYGRLLPRARRGLLRHRPGGDAQEPHNRRDGVKKAPAGSRRGLCRARNYAAGSSYSSAR